MPSYNWLSFRLEITLVQIYVTVFFARVAELVFEEIIPGVEEGEWRDELKVNGLTKEALALRKSACR